MLHVDFEVKFFTALFGDAIVACVGGMGAGLGKNTIEF
jgi:hypothetical protein